MKEIIVLLIIAVILLALPHMAVACHVEVAIETTGNSGIYLSAVESTNNIIVQEVFPFKNDDSLYDLVTSSHHWWNPTAAAFDSRHSGRFLISLIHFFRI